MEDDIFGHADLWLKMPNCRIIFSSHPMMPSMLGAHVSLQALNVASMVKHLEIESHKGDDPKTKNSRALDRIDD